ncbi:MULTISPECIES: hypothetical protein [Streptomyces]|uniref:hypothetical protein n=1 Tax=Streptomyces TaxID=1883 RepID=UPI001E651EDA|nr:MULTISPECIES: hypothetical protein [Streptomyces]UFQ15653.1 hypothetical protein J2N69_11970 [Streptomyces huasconensis]WCL85256.1 hypothetical protein PPN52_11980 [Streptomyces sp. JCM 35825]
MPEHARPTPRICPTCDGFASVKVTRGGRDRHGHLHTITAHCTDCHGTGHTRTTRTREGARV